MVSEPVQAHAVSHWPIGIVWIEIDDLLEPLHGVGGEVLMAFEPLPRLEAVVFCNVVGGLKVRGSQGEGLLVGFGLCCGARALVLGCDERSEFVGSVPGGVAKRSDSGQ